MSNEEGFDLCSRFLHMRPGTVDAGGICFGSDIRNIVILYSNNSPKQDARTFVAELWCRSECLSTLPKVSALRGRVAGGKIW